MIDMHHHLLYGIDDGPDDFDTAAQMALRACENGVHTLIATPHVYPGVHPFRQEAYQQGLIRLKQFCAEKKLPLAILGGAEIRHTEAAVRLLSEGSIPTMNGTHFVLVEWSTRADEHTITRAIREYSNAGYSVIIAHIERYKSLWLKRKTVESLKRSFDVRVQVDCEALLEKGSYWMKRFALGLLEDDLVDYVASDAHDLLHRPVCMAQCREWLSERYGEEAAHQLTGVNQEELCVF